MFSMKFDAGLLVVDIDGTLVGKNGTIAAADRNALNEVRRSGVAVSLATGRGIKTCSGIFHQLSLEGYHILFDGALVTDPEHTEEVYIKYIDPAVVEEAVGYAREHGLHLELYSATDYFVESRSWHSDVRRRFFGLEPVVADFDGLWHRERIIKGGMVTASSEEADQARQFSLRFSQRLSFMQATTPAYQGLTFVNILAPEVSKGEALKVLTSYLEVPLDRVMAIGDGENDIPMLALAGLSVAMANAPGEVKATVDHVTLDIEHGGVAAAVSRFLL